ncbi:MAG: hypothetical protein EBZ60_06345 [Betaproteobacteria bacterium]|nr:hypothetical protein [Betaproteobacteria bacterium]
MSITRDRELADLLYASHNHLSQLKIDLDLLHEHANAAKSPATVAADHHHSPIHHAHADEPSEHDHAMVDALSKVNLLKNNLETVISLIIKNHTDATSIINEFEKIRTAKLLSSETFALAHLINPPSK